MYYTPADMRVIFSPLVVALLVKDLLPPPHLPLPIIHSLSAEH